MTDGAVGNEQALMGLIHSELGNRRLFTVGIGSAPNTHFMTEAAHFGRGSFTYIGRISEVKEKMAGLFAHLEHPALTDLRLTLPVQAETLPDPLPDLYVGEPVVAVMRLDGKPDNALLEGNVGNLQWRNQLALRASSEQTGLGVQWARENIRQISRSEARGADHDQVRNAILQLALRHHLVSRYTSLVAVDRTPVRPADAALQNHALQNNLPAGWQPSDQAARQIAMAQGATSFQVWLAAGLFLLLAGGLLWLGLPQRGRREAW